MSRCAYINCPNIQRPYSSLAFFTLPRDNRRQQWLERSGNADKYTEHYERKVFCRKHFEPKYLRKQFNRITLRRDAVPIQYVNETLDSTLPEPEYLEGFYFNYFLSIP